MSDRAAADLVTLAHRLAEPARDLTGPGEGGVAGRIDGGTVLASAPGADLAALGAADLSRGDASTIAAVCLAASSAQVAAHVQPPAVDALLCSGRASLLAQGPLVPAHAAICGPRPLVVAECPPSPAALGELIGDRLTADGEPARVVHVAGHGLIALAGDGDEALRIATSAARAARVLHGALAAGGTDPATTRPLLLGAERREIVRIARRMDADRLTISTSGNLSIRAGDLVAITPSGVDAAALRPETVGVHRLDGTAVDAPLAPSSELPFHLAIYAQSDASAAVHTHSLHATAVSTLVDELPAIHYLLGLFGGPVRTAPYATFGSDELAAHLTRALKGRHGALLANHGAVTTGGTLAEAYTRALYLEWLCELYVTASVAGDPRLVPADELDRIVGRLDRYRRGAG